MRSETPGAIHGLEAVGTPNQFVHCALGLLKASLLLQDLREGPDWTRIAIERMEWYVDTGGYLADGSDMEPSFNYNPGLIHALDSILQLARANPPLKGRDLSDGRRVTYLVSSGGELQAGGIGVEGQALLLSTDPAGKTCGLMLRADGVGGREFELDDTGALREIADIRVPGGFRWVDTGGNLEPRYD